MNAYPLHLLYTGVFLTMPFASQRARRMSLPGADPRMPLARTGPCTRMSRPVIIQAGACCNGAAIRPPQALNDWQGKQPPVCRAGVKWAE